ncbi:hypothetical protein MMC31_000552 [Peltigera leucophlebia]|nr:hypothetical protein [Peltigera leucophlebia]
MASIGSLLSALLLASSLPLALTADPQPYFGNKDGNFQPTRTSRNGGAVIKLTGGQVGGALAVNSINNQDGTGVGSDTYTQYCGNGDAFPPKSKWVSFEQMFNANKPLMFASCGYNNWGADDSGPEIGAIYDSIQEVALETKVDHRFILAVIMQESGGCVRVPTSNFGVRNPGLMQCHNGDGTCNSDITGQVQNPCPTGAITQMIREGSAGTSDGDGLAQCINLSNSASVTGFYKAARIYNSGSIDASGDLCKGIATKCYASDIANRLTGWVYADHNCFL